MTAGYQHPLGPYVVNFFCEAESVVIELDTARPGGVTRAVAGMENAGATRKSGGNARKPLTRRLVGRTKQPEN
jgi:hypothetical protein